MDTLAAVDLGSNSFRLQVGRVIGDQIYPLDGLREPVRLAAGLDAEKRLDAAAQERALAALARFAERLRGFAPEAVRAVGTNALRVAKNAAEFLGRAESVLGFPIEVISGLEEARLIYLGVAHTLPHRRRRRLVVDIGGGSTEFIIGQGFEPKALESLYMGCVSYSMRFFPGGEIDKKSMREAILAARREIEAIAENFHALGWEEAIGSAGSIRAIRDILEETGWSPAGTITAEGLARLKNQLLRAGRVERALLPALRPDRALVLPGGVAILTAIFEGLGIETMGYGSGGLRLGVLYDLLGRYHHEDMREATVARYQKRYEVDRRQAERVRETALALYRQLYPHVVLEEDIDAQYLSWAASLHEIGISIAHSSYHKHGAYILAHADMPGFSKRDQLRLSQLVLAHRGKLERVDLPPTAKEWDTIFCLRLAALLHRARVDAPMPPLTVHRRDHGFVVEIDRSWLTHAPLTAANLEEERGHWRLVGLELKIRTHREQE
ncbi:MAG: exopolyphosphatase [Rhodocyclaceae bacterium]|nr:exopolyphosphatase [Rhodocyclaceae bacterium]